MDLKFGDFTLKQNERQIAGPSGVAELSARSFDILMVLLGKPGELVSKEDLLDSVWPGVIVEDNTLQVHMTQLRKVLPPSVIATVHGRGYRYVGPKPEAAAHPGRAERPDRKPAVVVLPFENAGGDPEQQYFSDGITEDIADRLTRFRVLSVIGPHSAAAFRGPAPDFAAIRDKLDVEFVVTGSLRRAGDRIRIAIRLSSTVTAEALWAERYDRPLSDLFALQDEISELVAAALARHLEVQVNVRNARRPPASLSSYDHLLQGYWHFKKLNRKSNLHARACFERAVETDPGNAEALGWLGITYCENWIQSFSVEHAEKGVGLTGQAITVDPANALVWAIHTWALLCVGDLNAALGASERSMLLNPGEPGVLVNRALALSYAGNLAEAGQLIRQANRLEPVPPPWFGEFAGVMAFADGRYEDTLAGVEPIGEYAWDTMYTMACHGLRGDAARAKAALDGIRRLGPEPDWNIGISREPYRSQELQERLREGVAKALAFSR